MDRDTLGFSKLNVKHVIDVSEKLNSYFTVIILVFASFIVGYKTYVVSPIECYSSVFEKGSNFERYLVSYCWVKGTFKSSNGTRVGEDWKNQKKLILYYPWIPFILLIQALLFYLPYACWREYCKTKYGNLKQFMNKLVDASKSTRRDDYNSNVEFLCEEMEAMLYMSRDFCHNYWDKLKRRIYKRFPFICAHKRQGNRLVIVYMFLKFSLLINCIIQINILVKFLKIDYSFFSIYYNVLSVIFHGEEWQESEYFPRVTFCQIQGLASLGVNNKYAAQCVLSINVLNEKLFLFLFLWMGLIFTISVISLLSYLNTAFIRPTRVRAIKKYLKMKGVYKKYESLLIVKFVDDFLRLDGCFLINVARYNAGESITAEIVTRLWRTFKEKYRQMDFNRDDVCERQSMSLKLERCEESSLKCKPNNSNNPPMKPTAPNKEMYM